ncbi:hypothetical protein D3C79_780530 [compost metagenome]
MLEQRRIDGVNLQRDLDALGVRLERLDLAGLQPQIEHGGADADAIGLLGAQDPGLRFGITTAKQGQLLTGVEAVNPLAARHLDQLDPARQPGTRRAGFHLDPAQIGGDLQRRRPIETGPRQQGAIRLIHLQLDARIAAGVERQLPYLPDLQPLEQQRGPFAHPGEIIRLQS